MQMFVQPHYPCNCCSTCQYEIKTFQTKYNLLTNDYQKLKQKDRLNNSSTNIYRQENINLNALKIEQQTHINLLQEKYEQNKWISPDRSINIDRLSVQNQLIRKHQNKINELNRTIAQKNDDLMRMREQMDMKNQQIRRGQENNYNLMAKVHQLSKGTEFLQERLQFIQKKHGHLQGQIQKYGNHKSHLQKTSDTRDRNNSKAFQSHLKHSLMDNGHKNRSSYNLSRPIQNLNNLKKINTIQSKIIQLQQENNNLRNVLSSKI